MKQTRAMSLLEALANVAVGYRIAVVTQMLVFPLFGMHTSLAQNLEIRRRVHRSVHSPQLCAAAAVRGDSGRGIEAVSLGQVQAEGV